MSTATSERPGRTDRPNLVFIFSDEQSRDMVGAYGASQVLTPRLDAVAREGILFDHCVSSSPICTPWRGMLITGQHPFWNNCFTNDRHLRTDIGDSFAEVMGKAGYRNGYVGKWHLQGGKRDRPIPPGPDRHGFDDCFLSNNCHLNYDPDHAFFWDGDTKRLFGTWEVEGQTNQALDYLDTQTPESPFSLFVSYHAPHFHQGGDPERYSTFGAPDEFLALYDTDDVVPRISVPNNEKTRLMTQGYFAMCSEVDHHVGRIVDRLKARGLWEHTIFVYTSDHGESFGAYNSPMHKDTPEDVSIRVPLIVRLPDGTGAGRRSQLIVGALDLMPTLLSLMGLPVPEECQGLDLAPAIRAGDDDAVESTPLFSMAASNQWRGVYTRRWTYSFENIDRSPRGLARVGGDLGREVLLRGFDTLYDHDEDPNQFYNLFGQAGWIGDYRETQRELHELTLKWMERYQDPFPNQTELRERVGPSEDRPLDALRPLPDGAPAGVK